MFRYGRTTKYAKARVNWFKRANAEPVE